jgi:hypothetical protein
MFTVAVKLDELITDLLVYLDVDTEDEVITKLIEARNELYARARAEFAVKERD